MSTGIEILGLSDDTCKAAGCASWQFIGPTGMRPLIRALAFMPVFQQYNRRSLQKYSSRQNSEGRGFARDIFYRHRSTLQTPSARQKFGLRHQSCSGSVQLPCSIHRLVLQTSNCSGDVVNLIVVNIWSIPCAALPLPFERTPEGQIPRLLDNSVL